MNLVLSDKIYVVSNGKNKEDVFLRYLKYLNEHIKGFPNTSIKIKKLREFDKRFEIVIESPEEVFISSLLKKEIGVIREFKDIKEGEIYKGTMVDVKKVGFGIFMDCAIMNPKTDVLLNLHTLRDQLCKGCEKSLKEIIDGYNFIDHFPGYIKITKIDRENFNVQGEFAPYSLNIFKKILDENIEAVFMSGETKGQFKKIILRKGHFRDIISIKRFGFLENLVLLKKGSDAPGIIAHIGKKLENCKLSALRPKRIRRLFN
ncbi:hypothetical protein LCGC14_1140440 [marine sediment metagenome]|uniref:DUF2110 family protein n=1 Tax=marine sediment metagenome TaxID=412755 RepID=A0A0F9Q462_9ZZZZ|nr:MAG: hypothetical protein Lokiarch_01520 [Candidatus Lokiarchaeum sp. GC14_75]